MTGATIASGVSNHSSTTASVSSDWEVIIGVIFLTRSVLPCLKDFLLELEALVLLSSVAMTDIAWKILMIKHSTD